MILPIIVVRRLPAVGAERPVAPVDDRPGERNGPPGAWLEVKRRETETPPACRLRALPQRRVLGREVAVAVGLRARLLGLSRLCREEAGPGLLIPRCASVHTFGMRFRLDLVFLDGEGRVLEVRRRVGRGRLVWRRGARAVLEIPSAGGESAAAGT